MIPGSTREYCGAWFKSDRIGWTQADCVRYPAALASRDWAGEYVEALQERGWRLVPSGAVGSHTLERPAADPDCVERLNILDTGTDNNAPPIGEPWRSKFVNMGIDLDAPIDGTLIFFMLPMCGAERAK